MLAFLLQNTNHTTGINTSMQTWYYHDINVALTALLVQYFYLMLSGDKQNILHNMNDMFMIQMPIKQVLHFHNKL